MKSHALEKMKSILLEVHKKLQEITGKFFSDAASCVKFLANKFGDGYAPSYNILLKSSKNSLNMNVD